MKPTATYDVLDVFHACAALGIAAGVRFRWEKLALAELRRLGPDARIALPFRVTGLAAPLKRWQLRRLVDWGVLERGVDYDPNGAPESAFAAADLSRGYRLTPLGVAVANAAPRLAEALAKTG